MGKLYPLGYKYEKDAHCSETDFGVLEFFFVPIFFFWDMVDFVLNFCSELGDFCEPDSETLTSDTR